MNETNKKLPLYSERQSELSESNISTISDEELIEKIQHYHRTCIEWQKIVQEWLNENK